MYKIPLSIKDNKKFQDIALLVDRPDFQNKYLDRLFREGKRTYKKLKGLGLFLETSKPFDLATEIVNKYQYPIGFRRALVALATNQMITDKDVEDCYLRFLVLPANSDIKYPVPLNHIAIFIDPHGIHEQRKEIVKQLNQIIMKAAKNAKPLPSKHPLSLSIMREVRNHRDLYWKRTEDHIPTLQLASEYGKAGNTLDKEVSNYLKLLKSPI